MVRALSTYYACQLRTRKGFGIKSPRIGGRVLKTQILLRKTYYIKIRIQTGYLRKSYCNLSAYVGLHVKLRDTQIFLGVPYHIFSVHIK